MPELPEVETTRRGIEPLVINKIVGHVQIYNASLRWPVSGELVDALPGQRVSSVDRRSKYLLFNFDHGTLIVHLGMTGHLRVDAYTADRRKHDHVEIVFKDGSSLRYNDSRRFGAILWTESDPYKHVRLAGLGPEPFSPEFNAAYLYKLSRGRSIAVKPFLMNAHVVVGVGNIYASEALFRAGIFTHLFCRKNHTGSLWSPGTISQEDSRCSNFCRRYHDSQLFRQSGATGIFCAGTLCLRTGRTSLYFLWRPH